MKKFLRRRENFTCSVCKAEIKGTDYTDHCPNCLWSKHMDKNPGDRQANCGGLMEPTNVQRKEGGWRIFYHCRRCGYSRWNKATPEDNFQKIIILSKNPLS